MKSFNDWMEEIAETVSKAEKSAPINCDFEVLDYNTTGDGCVIPLEEWIYLCRSCGKIIEINDHCEPENFTAEYAYCGSSARCIP